MERAESVQGDDCCNTPQGAGSSAQDLQFASSYEALRRLAHWRLSGGGRDTFLDTTVLVHESYLRLAQSGVLALEDRRSFLAYATQVMRSVIVDRARARMAERRGGDIRHVTMPTGFADQVAIEEDARVVEVHDALLALEQTNLRLAQMVTMRFFAGFSDVEIAELFQVTVRTVQRDWEKARILLQSLLASA